MKFSELKSKSPAELKEMLEKEREHWRELKFRVGARELKNIREIRKVKKLIAQIQTLLNAAKQ